ncbi:MAG: GNAT family N-acetyltransferase [Candidatus Heimdallarchaeota archaeon]|nr:GNAT family N-acetyltransferase [Candidatus Heimdallarchaeota archaeon]MCK4769639.1 GNAT family N-acetyltransferase [Candidatus Heimdallarchaeota archaeon]
MMDDLIAKKSPFIGEKIILRAIERDDIDSIMEYWNTYETRVGKGKFIPESRKQREEWIEKTTKDAKQGKGFTFAIIEKLSDQFLGACSLKRINAVNRGAFLSISIYNPENHDKGYGTEAVKCLLRIGFDILNLHRIELHVYEFLESAIHVYEKLGFKKTGVRREASFIAGEYRNDLIMDILETEYNKK